MTVLRRTLPMCLSALALCGGSLSAHASLKPDRVHAVDGKKTQAYIKDGVFVGGDRAIDSVVVKNIRRSANAGFERIVIDLEGLRGGEKPKIQRAPFYHVAVSGFEDRMIITLWGKPKLAFDPTAVTQSFKKSTQVGPFTLLPKVEDDTWSFVMGIKGGKSVEVFELTNPVRIVVDIKPSKSASAKPAPKAPVAAPFVADPLPGQSE